MTHPKDVNIILKGKTCVVWLLTCILYLYYILKIIFYKLESESHEHHHIESPHRAVGLALLLGFVFMLLVDQIGGATHSHAPDNIRLGKCFFNFSLLILLNIYSTKLLCAYTM